MEIGQRLHVSEHTVDTEAASVLGKLRVAGLAVGDLAGHVSQLAAR